MRKLLIAVLIILSIGLAGGVGYLFMRSDRQGPEIQVPEGKDVRYFPGMSDKDILTGMTAVDAVDGDVSDSLTVENVFIRSAEEAVAVIVAKDSKNNVSKKEYVLSTKGVDNLAAPGLADIREESKESDKEAAGEEASEAEEKPEEAEEKPEEAETEPEETEEKPEEAKAPEEPALTPQEEAKKREEDKIAALADAAPRFYLTTYYVEVPIGSSFDSLGYVSDIRDDKDETSELFRKIQIEGTLDTNTAGTYELNYYVVDNDGNTSNRAVLTIVVG